MISCPGCAQEGRPLYLAPELPVDDPANPSLVFRDHQLLSSLNEFPTGGPAVRDGERCVVLDSQVASMSAYNLDSEMLVTREVEFVKVDCGPGDDGAPRRGWLVRDYLAGPSSGHTPLARLASM